MIGEGGDPGHLLGVGGDLLAPKYNRCQMDHICSETFLEKVMHEVLFTALQVRFADQEQESGASHGGPGGLMGAQGGPQAYSQEPIYTPRILRDPGEPVNRSSQPHVQFDMGGV